MKNKIVVSIVGLLIIATCFFSVTANRNLQLKKELYNNKYPSSMDLLNDNKLNLGKSIILKEKSSCEHFAYYSSDDDLCWIYKLFLTPPYNSTCVCGGESGSGPFFPSGTWTTDDRLLVTEYQNGALWEIDLENCDLIEIGGGGVGLNGLTYDPTSGKVYGCSSSDLFEIDPYTGAQEVIGFFNIGTTMTEIACDADGVMYGWDVKFSGNSILYTINKETGEATPIGSMGMTLLYAQDGDFCRECDILYLAAFVYSPIYGSYLIECDEDIGECEILCSLNNYAGLFVIPYQCNLRPIAEFNWTPEIPEPGKEILFNASESYDPDGYIKLYEWDWDNDGVFDEKNYTCPLATHTFDEKGYYPVTLRVHDNNFTNNSVTMIVRVGNEPPSTPEIDGKKIFKVGESGDYTYNISSIDPDNDNIYYFIELGGWFGPYNSGEKVSRNIYINAEEKGNHSVFRIKARDVCGAESDWATLEITVPKSFNWFMNFLYRFPLLHRLLEGLIK